MRLAAFLLMLWAGGAEAACRQALALGLDVSGSVDAGEYRLQLDGLAGALNHAEVRAALLAMPGTPVRLAIYEWSGPSDQRLVLPWTEIGNGAILDSVIARLHVTARVQADPSTALGSALRYGVDMLSGQNCWRRTLDISGDGKANTGPHLPDVHAALPDWVTVNGLTIGQSATSNSSDTRLMGLGELSAYYGAYVIHGPDAFVETALGFDDYERAMVRKLRRELAILAVSSGPDLRDD